MNNSKRYNVQIQAKSLRNMGKIVKFDYKDLPLSSARRLRKKYLELYGDKIIHIEVINQVNGKRVIPLCL